jgi:diaminopimelate epimerase
MELEFCKMTGAGNDFVVIDSRGDRDLLEEGQIERLCDRHFGVGADGLLAVEEADEEGGDYRMRYYNADGGEAEMCGNGARCFARYVNERLHGGKLESLSFMTPAGLIRARFPGGREVEVGLSAPGPVVMGMGVELGGGRLEVHSVNTGVPHACVFVDELAAVDVGGLGRELREHETFAPAGTNVNFVAVEGGDAIAIRTYERGVEDETLACGTGMVASALVHDQRTGCGSPVRVRVAGGDVCRVEFRRDGAGYGEVVLAGPADFVFEGRVEL